MVASNWPNATMDLKLLQLQFSFQGNLVVLEGIVSQPELQLITTLAASQNASHNPECIMRFLYSMQSEQPAGLPPVVHEILQEFS